jgi:hypothetical protein
LFLVGDPAANVFAGKKIKEIQQWKMHERRERKIKK